MPCLTGWRGFAPIRGYEIRLFEPVRSMAHVGALPDLPHVRPTGARVALPLLAVLHTPDSSRVSLLLLGTPRERANHRPHRPQPPTPRKRPAERRGPGRSVLGVTVGNPCRHRPPNPRERRPRYGAGDAVATLRRLSSSFFARSRPSYRPNPFEADLDALVAEDRALGGLGTRPGDAAPKTASTRILLRPTRSLLTDRGSNLLLPPPTPWGSTSRTSMARRTRGPEAPPGRGRRRLRPLSSVRRVVEKGHSANFALGGFSELRLEVFRHSPSILGTRGFRLRPRQ
jgi:hypothetical protein